VPITVPIPKLAATPTRPRRLQNGLLAPNSSKMKQATALREAYGEIAGEWDGFEDNKSLYEFAEPKTRELLLGTEEDVNAVHDFDTASMYAHSGNWKMASQYLGYALRKVAEKIEKLGYGYDVSGETGRGSGGTSGNDRHLWDTGNAPKHDHTGVNPANIMFDTEAESDYPELAAFKHKRVHWPPRTR
jgi:hypothetical protein